jgi:hypothetical protein
MTKIVVAYANTLVIANSQIPSTILIEKDFASLRIVCGNFMEPTDQLTLNIARHSDGNWSVDVVKPQDDPHDLMCSAWIDGDLVMGQRVPTSARLVAVHTVEKEQSDDAL